MIVDVLPGGFEPILDDLTPPPEERNAAAWYPDYVDAREDRVVAFGAIGPEMRELRYRIRATTAGRFVVPPAYAESMYDPAAQARSLGAQVVVEAR